VVGFLINKILWVVGDNKIKNFMTGPWFSLGNHVSSTNKIDFQAITEIWIVERGIKMPGW
jgi:hypothetical protein